MSRKNTRVSTSSSRWMLKEKFGGMNKKSYVRNDNAAHASAGPRLLRTATSNTAARNTKEILGSASTLDTAQARPAAMTVASRASR
ncbi:hypothetical protein D3C76_488170 [compost metagenome]